VRDVTGDEQADVVSFTRGAPGTVSVAKNNHASVRNWIFDLDAMNNPDQNESNGDDPYFVLIGFRTTVGRAGSTQVVWGGDVREIFTNLPQNTFALIPDAMGRITFTGINRLSFQTPAVNPQVTFVNGVSNVELFGVFIAALESDATPDSLVSALANATVSRLRQILRNNVETIVARNLPELFSQLQTRMATVKVQADSSFLEEFAIAVASAGDPDDPIGMDLRAFINVDKTVPDFLNIFIPAPLSLVRERLYIFPPAGVPGEITFSGDATRWVAAGTMRSVRP
jgi:hypothetical protein